MDDDMEKHDGGGEEPLSFAEEKAQIDLLFKTFAQRNGDKKWIQHPSYPCMLMLTGTSQKFYLLGSSLDDSEVFLFRRRGKKKTVVRTAKSRMEFTDPFVWTNYHRERERHLQEELVNMCVVVRWLWAGVLLCGLVIGAQCTRPMTAPSASQPTSEKRPWEALPNFRFGTSYQKAETLFVHDQHREAVVEIEKGFEAHARGEALESLHQLYALRGQIHAKLGHVHLAIRDLEESVRLSGVLVQPTPYDQLAELWERAGDRKRAERYRSIYDRVLNGPHAGLEGEIREVVGVKEKQK